LSEHPPAQPPDRGFAPGCALYATGLKPRCPRTRRQGTAPRNRQQETTVFVALCRLGPGLRLAAEFPPRAGGGRIKGPAQAQPGGGSRLSSQRRAREHLNPSLGVLERALTKRPISDYSARPLFADACSHAAQAQGQAALAAQALQAVGHETADAPRHGPCSKKAC